MTGCRQRGAPCFALLAVLALGSVLAVQAFTLQPFIPNPIRSTGRGGTQVFAARARRKGLLVFAKHETGLRVADVAEEIAQREGKGGGAELGFSFSVAGLFFSYQLGVAEVLKEEGLLNENTPLVCASLFPQRKVFVCVRFSADFQ